ncbi:MAG: Gfo/Idh/MocA family oxidoreductase [Candidatus Omnitrophica bacterium]|nr:Gfo/Idh/MocA family oxidoreductase [Candidatus Omnitrophota bacterium]
MSVQTKPLKVGVIGLGVGQAHVEAYDRHPQVNIFALCDLAEEKRAWALESYPEAGFTSSAEEILTDPRIDVVSICSYDDIHYEQIMLALEHNKHVFVEKPLCLKSEHARDIRRALDEKPHLKISSNLILRKCPRFIALREKILAGDFGELFCIEGDYNYGRLWKVTEGWRGQLEFYSIVLGGGVHIIDLFLWLTGSRVKEVTAYGNQIASRGTQFRYPDLVSAILQFENGMTGKLTVNYGCMQPHFHNLMIYGTGATYVNDLEYGRLYTSRDPLQPFTKMTQPYPGVHKGDLLDDFIAAIGEDREPQITKTDIFDAISICLAIEKSINHGPVAVDYI